MNRTNFHALPIFGSFSFGIATEVDDDGGMFNSDSLSMVKKLHDVRKNSSSELLARDAVTYEPQLSCADGRVESNPAGFVLEPQSKFS